MGSSALMIELSMLLLEAAAAAAGLAAFAVLAGAPPCRRRGHRQARAWLSHAPSPTARSTQWAAWQRGVLSRVPGIVAAARCPPPQRRTII